MKINVTEDDIKNGVVFACYKCPIALAVKRAVGAANVRVGTETIRIFKGAVPRHFKMTDAAKVFVKDFDDSKPVQPFSFDLNET